MDINEYNLKISEIEMSQSNQMLQWMGDFAKITFTSLILTNGTAIISILTFIGNSKFIQNFSNLWFVSISLFCFGLFSIISAIIYAFWAQKIYREGLDKDIKNGKETDIKIKNKIGTKKRIWAIILTSASLSSFITGCIFTIFALSKSF